MALDQTRAMWEKWYKLPLAVRAAYIEKYQGEFNAAWAVLTNFAASVSFDDLIDSTRVHSRAPPP